MSNLSIERTVAGTPAPAATETPAAQATVETDATDAPVAEAAVETDATDAPAEAAADPAAAATEASTGESTEG